MHAHAGARAKAKRQKADLFHLASAYMLRLALPPPTRRVRRYTFSAGAKGRRRCFLSALRLAICRAVERNFICANALHVNVITKPICCLLGGERASVRTGRAHFDFPGAAAFELKRQNKKTRPFEIRLFRLETNFCVSNFLSDAGWITADFSESV